MNYDTWKLASPYKGTPPKMLMYSCHACKRVVLVKDKATIKVGQLTKVIHINCKESWKK